ncbi:MAG: SLC13 family permease [Candidatus Dormibacteria bacterium]
MLPQIALLALFFMSAAAVTVRPWRISEGWWPIVAVAAALAIGAIPLAAALRGFGSSLDVLAFFAGLLLLAAALRRTGVVDRVLDWLEEWSRGEPLRLLAGVALTTVAVTALLSNDGAALVLAPAVLDRLQRRGIGLTPYVLTMAFTANAASALLPISNPVNLLILDRAHVDLPRYLVGVTPAALLGVTITVLACLLLTGRDLAPGLPTPDGGRAPGRRATPAARWVLGLSGLLVLTDVAFAVARLPIGPPTLVAGALATGLVWLASDSRELPIGIGWSILLMVAGFSVLASGLAHSRWLAAMAHWFTSGGSAVVVFISTGLVTAGISGVINNLPAALLVTAGLQAAHHHLGTLALPAIVGADLGPNLAPFGSLSTILVLAAVRRRGKPLPLGRLWRLGLVVGTLALLPTLGVVALSR